MTDKKIDLLSFVEYGGCSAKLPADKLSELLSQVPLLKSANIMVDVDTHDDAGVYRLNDTTALIVTTDFFPPVCSDPYEFGQIAAANSLSDVYAMGGTPLLTLNLNMYPSTEPLEGLRDILLGGQDKINEAGAFTMGGHTIEDPIPKYGLAVVGTVNPKELVTNSGSKVGDVLILTKPLGVGVALGAHRLGLITTESYCEALSQMKQLNSHAAAVMRTFGVCGATDITGFGLLGHAHKMAVASGVSFEISSLSLPLLPDILMLLEDGCIPGAAFRNRDFVASDVQFSDSVSYEYRMVCFDAQTSGGMLLSVSEAKAEDALQELKMVYPHSQIIGRATPIRNKRVYVY